MSQLPPQAFINFNTSNDKQLVIAVQIDGLSDLLATAPIGTRLRYGDPVVYGGAGLFYGGLRPYVSPTGGTVKQYISLPDSSLSINQVLEAEQGRSSVAQLSIGFIDVDNYMTQVISPGILLPEILGRQVKVYIGYAQLSFPEEYLLCFRGLVQNVQSKPGVVVLQFGDPNVRRRQQIFYCEQAEIVGDITDSQTTITVTDNAGFATRIIGPDGNYDSGVKLYFAIDDEIIEYTTATVGVNTFTGVTRGARGTTPDAHSDGTQINASYEIGGNPMDLALKIMLSGWNGPYLTGQTLFSFQYTNDPANPIVTNGMVLHNQTDAILDLGIAIGDYIYTSGDPNAENNGTFRVQGFQQNFGLPNRIIIVDGPLATSINTPATFDVRSQYDTLPDNCGLRMPSYEVDVQAHQQLKALILSTLSDDLLFYITEAEDSGKTFLESEIYLASSSYSITVNGQMSVKMTLPPFAGNALQTLDTTNVVTPQQIMLQRGLSNRAFYNEVDWTYAFDDAGDSLETDVFIDAASQSDAEIGLVSILPITTHGITADNSEVVAQRADRLLARYKRGAVSITLTVNFGTANQVNLGDVILMKDPPNGLQISNIQTGTRGLGNQLFEVINRVLDMRNGVGNLTLLSAVNFSSQDVFATWAPSSMCAPLGSTVNSISILPSYGAVFFTQEYLKWQPYIGGEILVHNQDYSVSAVTVITGVSAANVITVSPALSFVPDATTIVDLNNYATSTDPNFEATEKLVHCFWDKSVAVAAGINATSFTINSSDVQYFNVGYPLVVHSNLYAGHDWLYVSLETTITAISGTTITCGALLDQTSGAPITPVAGDICELMAFNDLRGPYRWI